MPVFWISNSGFCNEHQLECEVAVPVILLLLINKKKVSLVSLENRFLASDSYVFDSLLMKTISNVTLRCQFDTI